MTGLEWLWWLLPPIGVLVFVAFLAGATAGVSLARRFGSAQTEPKPDQARERLRTHPLDRYPVHLDYIKDPNGGFKVWLDVEKLADTSGFWQNEPQNWVIFDEFGNVIHSGKWTYDFRFGRNQVVIFHGRLDSRPESAEIEFGIADVVRVVDARYLNAKNGRI